MQRVPRIVDIGHRRQMDLAVEVPKDELGAVATNAVWSDVYDRVADLVREHRSCLVFVNTRRLAERVAHHLEERLGGQVVAAHHGSLSRQIRLSAEERLKRGETRVVVATASLELGIDVGTVDLVCQIGSPRAIATCLQRVGRSGHWVGALPKGRLFATTRDELLECAALVRAIRSGTLDRLDVPDAPMDILAQQIVATVATGEWQEDELFHLCRRAYPYRGLDRNDFDAVVQMLADGIDTRRGRGRAYLHHDRVNRRLRARRGARLAAITSGGAIPDTANYAEVAAIRQEIAKRLPSSAISYQPSAISSPETAISHQLSAISWLEAECGLDRRGAEQAVAYVAAGRAVLGAVPTQQTIIAERFFDEGGGMQLVLHAPFGGRLNRAWGLALRKRFCVTFDFELQAAATDEGIVISL